MHIPTRSKYMERNMSPRISFEEYCKFAPGQCYLPLLRKVYKAIGPAIVEPIHSYAIFRYVAFHDGRQNFVSLWCKTTGLYIETKIPRFNTDIGRKFTDAVTLNYRIRIHDEASLSEVLRVIINSYSQVKKKKY